MEDIINLECKYYLKNVKEDKIIIRDCLKKCSI